MFVLVCVSPLTRAAVCVAAGCVVFPDSETCVLASFDTGIVYSVAGFELERRVASVGV